MSCYNWEAGTIQLPKSQFAKIRKQFIADYNRILEQQMEAGNKLREHVFALYKGKRGVKWHWVLDDHAEKFGVAWDTIGKIVHGTEGKKPPKLTKKRMEFANSKTMSFSLDGEGAVTFNPENKTVTYEVWENNRAVERARECRVGKLFFDTMRKIEWTRGSGGCLYGNDEYNKHESYGGDGGGNYITAQFGKNVDKRTRLW